MGYSIVVKNETVFMATIETILTFDENTLKLEIMAREAKNSFIY